MNWLSQTVAWLADRGNWSGPDGVPALAGQHLWLSAASLLIAAVIALPVAAWLGHRGRGDVIAVQVGNIGRAVPTLALLIMLVVAGPPFGFSQVSALTAFALFAIPPMLTNTVTGLRQVDRSVVDAARGMGMTGWQRFWLVELPLAWPLILTGIRLAAAQVVATVSIAALAAFGGLGRIVTRGFAAQDIGQILAGALLIAVLAVSTEAVFGLLGVLTGGRRRSRGRSVTAS